MGIEDGSTILLDTNCFIYYFEDNDIYADRLEELFTSIQNGKITAYMSVLSLLELLATALYVKADGFVTNDIRLKATCESKGMTLFGLDV